MKKKLLLFRLSIVCIIPAAHISGSPYIPLLVIYQLSYRFNMETVSGVGLCWRPMALFVTFCKISILGMKFGQLALQVMSKLDAKASKPSVFHILQEYSYYTVKFTLKKHGHCFERRLHSCT
jgi:hypothetical protein